MADHNHTFDLAGAMKEMSRSAPKEFKAWLDLDRIVGRDDGTIPRKYRELIALAVACTTQCEFCLEVHAKAAKQAGCTAEEVAEAAFLAAALRAGGAATHGALALAKFQQE
jgi:AhpD family alkylhydroperoxidase